MISWFSTDAKIVSLNCAIDENYEINKQIALRLK